MTPIRVVNVKGLRGEARKGVCYCGRAFAGWPASPWGNPFRPSKEHDAVCEFRRWFLDLSPIVRESLLHRLWEACGHGAKPLGCWCINCTHGDGQAVVCHGQVLAELLTEWVAKRHAEGLPC